MWLGTLTAGFILLAAFASSIEVASKDQLFFNERNDKLKKDAFEILDTKCNVCHRRRNPFMIFHEKNMVKRASKIYKMVFIEQRMPKGNEIRLTNEEYTTLKKWLFTQNIF